MPKYDATDAVRVEGLDDFRRALKALGAQWPKMLAKANHDAAELIARDAASKAGGQGGVAAKVSPSIKATTTAASASVQLGSNAYPMALGAEFGAKQYPQFKAWRGNQWEPDDANGVGYFLHPAIRETKTRFEDIYLEGIERLAHEAFPD